MPFDAGSILARMALDRRGFSQAVAAVKAETTGLQGDLTSRFKSIFKLGAMVTGAVAGIAAAIGVAVVKVAQQGEQYANLAEKTGWAVENLSTLVYAAEQSEASFGDVEIGLQGLANAMEGARGGNDALAKAFRDLNVPLKNADGTARSSTDVFYDLADAMARTESETKRSALAQDLFGRGGRNLIPLLRQGAEGIRQLETRGAFLAGDWTKASKAGDEFGDSLNDIKTAVGGLVRDLVVGLLPVMTEVNTRLANWVAANRALVATRVKEFAEALTPVLSGLGKGLLETARGSGIIAGIWQTLSILGTGLTEIFWALQTALRGIVYALVDVAALAAKVGVSMHLLSEGDAAGIQAMADSLKQSTRDAAAELGRLQADLLQKREALMANIQGRRPRDLGELTGIAPRIQVDLTLIHPEKVISDEVAKRIAPLLTEAQQEQLRQLRAAALEIQLAR